MLYKHGNHPSVEASGLFLAAAETPGRADRPGEPAVTSSARLIIRSLLLVYAPYWGSGEEAKAVTCRPHRQEVPGRWVLPQSLVG